MLAHLSASIFTSKSNHYSLIGNGILLYKFHKYCMIYRLFMFEKLKNIMRDTVCRRVLHHIVLGYYILDNVCRTFMRHIVVSYYIKATDVIKKCNPFCSKLLHFAYRCQCSCKAKCSNYYILQRYYILGCDNGKVFKSFFSPRGTGFPEYDTGSFVSLQKSTLYLRGPGQEPECQLTFVRGILHIAE